MILAALLVDGYRIGGRRKRILGEVALEVDDHILQRAAVAGDYAFGGRGAAGMRLGAIGLRSHVDVARLGRRAVELDGSSHGARGGRIDRLATRVSGRRGF